MKKLSHARPLFPNTERGETSVTASGLCSNPFATRFVAPGRVQWVGAENFFEQLVSRWEALNFRGSIVGVHGSGKSTLLEHFVPLIGNVVWRRNAEGQVIGGDRHGKAFGGVCNNDRPDVIWLQLRKNASQSMAIPWGELTPGRLLILDGYEQLTRWRRALLIARTNMRGVKLLLTSHRSTMLPMLCELSVSASTARQVILQLTQGRGVLPTITDGEIQKCLHARGGNMREILMDLYDQFEEDRANKEGKVRSKL